MMILDTIKAQASGILLLVAFSSGISAGFIGARYIYMLRIERMQSEQLKIDAERNAKVMADMAEIVALQQVELKRRLVAEEENRNAKDIIDKLLRDAAKRMRPVSIQRICDGGLPEGGTPASADSTNRALFEQYDAALADVRDASFELVRACEIDREDVILQAGGR